MVGRGMKRNGIGHRKKEDKDIEKKKIERDRKIREKFRRVEESTVKFFFYVYMRLYV